MPLYRKICVICSHKFDSIRRDAMYCSPNCKNRTRSMPKDLVRSLRKRNDQYMIKATKYIAMVADNDGNESAVGYTPEKATKEHPLGIDTGLLTGLARLDAEKKGIRLNKEKPVKKIEDIDDTGFGSTKLDDEMKKLQFELPENMIPIIDVADTQEIIDKIIQPKKFKIKPIQRNGGEK